MQHIIITTSSGLNDLTGNTPKYFDVQADCTVTGNVQFAPNSVLHFSGGKLIINGNLTGVNTVIDASPVQILQVSGSISGTWHINTAYPEWFGANGYGGSASDNDDAIAKTMALIPGEIRFTQGTYLVSETVYTTQIDGNNQPLSQDSTNIYIGKNATLKAASAMTVMIMGDYPYSAGVYGLTHLPKIYGGGTIDGNNMANIAIKLHQGYRVMVEHLYIKNILCYGFVAAENSAAGGSCVVRDCVFENHPNTNPNASDYGLLDQAIAIHNNRADCNYENIMIIDFKVAVKHCALNGKYINVHAWLSSSLYWSESVVFKCHQPDLNLYCCDADTMRKLVEVENVPYFFANIINCRAYKNNSIVSNELASSYKPMAIDKGDMEWSQIMIIGGVYWFDVEYVLISALSPSDDPDIGNSRLDRHYDRISVVRYNREKVQNGFIYDDYVCPLFHNQ